VERNTHLRPSLRFGPFELDVGSGELRHNGRKTLLHEQPFQVLLALLERPGELISREELVHRLWPDGTFVDYERGLNKAVNKLRDALRDSADSPRFVETIPRRGYRFIAPLEGGNALTMASGGPALAEAGGKLAIENRTSSVMAPQASVTPAWKRYALLAACAILLAVGFVTYQFWRRSNSPGGPAKITQISQWNKPMDTARLSPDGHAVAFVSPIGGIAQVFLMLTSGGEPLQLTNDEGDKFVDNFSPDGKEVYYGRPLGKGEIWAVPTLGGNAHRVASAYYGVPSPDGIHIYYCKFDKLGIFRADKSGLNEELVYNAESTGRFFVPLLIFPSGNDLLAAGVRVDSPNPRIFRINLTSHEAAELPVDPGQVSKNIDVAWAEPGNSILLSRNVNGLTNIWKFGLQDRSVTQITFGTGPDYSPMPDPGGRGIYFVNGKASGFMTAYHVNSKKSKDIVSEHATQPAISPDGKRVMYIMSPAPQRSELWVSDIDGGNKKRISTGEELGTGAWAPDNFQLSFVDASKVYIASADGSSLRQAPPMGIRPLSAVWSSDQKSVYVTSIEKAGLMPNVWKWNTDNSGTEKFVDKCCMVSAADPGGRYLLGVEPVGERIGIYEVSTSTGKCIPLLPGVETSAVTFARDGKSFLYAVTSSGEITIYRQPWSDGKIIGKPQIALKVPFAFPIVYEGGTAFDFSRDLSTMVYARPGGHADVYLLSQK
jgi:DNA-binding winged helix-turn-helix (wHTH) protein/Tol biopolymer transport system component